MVTDLMQISRLISTKLSNNEKWQSALEESRVLELGKELEIRELRQELLALRKLTGPRGPHLFLLNLLVLSSHFD